MIIIYYLAFVASIFLIYISVYFFKKLVKRKNKRACNRIAPIEATFFKDNHSITVGQLYESDNAHSKLCFEVSTLMNRLCNILNNRAEDIKIKETELLPYEFTQKSIAKSDYDKKRLCELVKKFYEFIENYSNIKLSEQTNHSYNTIFEEAKKIEHDASMQTEKIKEHYRKLIQPQQAVVVYLERPGLKTNEHCKVEIVPKIEGNDYPWLIGKLVKYKDDADDETIIDLENKVEVKK